MQKNYIKFAIILACIVGFSPVVGAQTAPERKIGPSGQPVPRFLSLKADEVSVRKGPGWDHAVAWVFRRAGLPVEVIAEFDVWRQVRDSESATGWVHGRLLSGRRTGLVAPWVKDDKSFTMHTAPSALSPAAARVQPGVLADVLSCDEGWCNVAAGNVTGWVQQDALFGVYPNETVQ